MDAATLEYQIYMLNCINVGDRLLVNSLDSDDWHGRKLVTDPDKL